MAEGRYLKLDDGPLKPDTTEEISDAPISCEEMQQMFGSTMPVEAIELMWAAPAEWTLADLRRKLREIAKRRNILRSRPEKPHLGRIFNWRRCHFRDDGLGYSIYGLFVDHPHLAGAYGTTSYITAHDEASGEIETRNSRYTLVGDEQTR